MIAYGIEYRLRNSDKTKSISIDARDLASAKKKIGKKNGYKDGRMVVIERATVIGYF